MGGKLWLVGRGAILGTQSSPESSHHFRIHGGTPEPDIHTQEQQDNTSLFLLLE